MFNKPKISLVTEPPCKHYWEKDIRTYRLNNGEYIRPIDTKPSWRCRYCREWETDINKNKGRSKIIS